MGERVTTPLDRVARLMGDVSFLDAKLLKVWAILVGAEGCVMNGAGGAIVL